jgi:hypothetical protein
MGKTRRASIVVGTLLLIGGLHSCCIREWGQCTGGFTSRDVVVLGQTGLGHWQLEVFALNNADPQISRRLDLPFLHLRISAGPRWWFSALGDWFSLAAMILIPALLFEVRARRRRRPGSGFPIEPKKNPAHTDGVNTFRVS